mgnify:CR=1 FL=1
MTLRQQLYFYLLDDKYIGYCEYKSLPTYHMVTATNTPTKCNTKSSPHYETTITDHNLLQLPDFVQDDETLTTHDDTHAHNWIIINTFDYFHTIVFDIMMQWMQTTEHKTHPFYIGWTKDIYLGLKCTTPWEEVCNRLSVQHIQEYIAYIS